MTCEECREILPLHPDQVSRASRSAMLVHLHQCGDCQDYMEKNLPEGTEEELQEAAIIMADDMKDPEFINPFLEDSHGPMAPPDQRHQRYLDGSQPG